MTSKQLVDLMRVIDTADRDDLTRLSSALKDRWDALRADARDQFKRGDRVRFATKRHGVVFATILDFNRKSVAVRSDSGMNWRVSPTLLVKIENEIGRTR